MGFGNWHVGTQSSGAKVKPVAYELLPVRLADKPGLKVSLADLL